MSRARGSRDASGSERRPRALVIDDSEGMREVIVGFLETAGWEADTADEGARGLALLEAGADPDLVLLDVMLPEIDGLEVLRRIRDFAPELPVVILSVVGTASTIVEAMRLGAMDYLNKPFEAEDFDRLLERARDRRLTRMQRVAQGGAAESGPLLEGPTWEPIREVLDQIADTDVSVLIQGESGVGKEVVARAIHRTSSRRAGPFVKVNCAALPGGLLESELFGFERGAFTGANARKPGKFEMADGGTMFLDEIGEMSPEAQAKLLHVLQDGSFSRLGSNRELRADARIVSATNRPLEELVGSGGFREDLFFRINVVNVKIPPLRERRDEALALMHHFLRQAAVRYGRPLHEPSPRLLALLERHPFPGNVRELENLMKRIVVLGSEDPVIDDLIQREARRRRRGAALREVLDEVEETAGDLPLREVGRRASQEAEREAIEQVLLRTGWNRKEAARMLKVSYKTLLQKIRETGITPI